MNFDDWNKALLEHHFNPANADRPVFLWINDTTLAEIGEHIGGVNGLLQAVRVGPNWCPNYDVENLGDTARVLRTHRLRNYPANGNPNITIDYLLNINHTPAYLPILAVLVYAASINGHGYYAEVCQLLGIEHGLFDGNTLNTINQCLFDDLAMWSEIHPEFGRFQNIGLGGYNILKYVRGQSILSPLDLNHTHRVLQQLHCRPGVALDINRQNQVYRTLQANRYLHATFTDALQLPNYEEVIKTILSQICEDWDGSIGTNEVGYPQADWFVEVNNAGMWSIGLALHHQRGNYSPFINFAGVRWTWTHAFDAYGTSYFRPQNHDGMVILQIIDSCDICIRAQNNEVKTIARFQAVDDFVIFERGHFGDGRQLIVAMECPLDDYFLLVKHQRLMNGPLAVLYNFPNSDPRQSFPQDWRLRYIQVGQLEDNNVQNILRANIPAIRRQPLSIKFVGGISRRQFGTRVYLPNEWPDIFVYASYGGEVHADGLDLQELPRQVFEQNNQHASASYRVFKIVQVYAPERAVYSISAGEQTKILRTIPDSTLVIAQNWSVNQYGGVFTNNNFFENLPSGYLNGLEQIPPQHVYRIVQRQTFIFVQNVVTNFLNILGALGNLSTLDARIQFENWNVDNPWQYVRLLHSCGNLEIITDVKGRWGRFVAIAPQIYRIGLGGANPQTEIWGITGTLRNQHWEFLSTIQAVTNGGVTVHEYPNDNDEQALPQIVLVGDILAYQNYFTAVDITIVDSASAEGLMLWSETLQSVLEHYINIGLEGGPNLHQVMDLEYFDPMQSKWYLNPAGYLSMQLLRYTDTQTGSHTVHQVRNTVNNLYTFAFVRDRYWGVWLTYNRALNDLQNMGLDVPYLMTLNYDRQNQILWIPYHMDFPVLLRRALILSSGRHPLIVQLKKLDVPFFTAQSNCLRYTLQNISTVYDQTLENNLFRRWIAYRNVPDRLVGLLAAKLICSIHNMQTIIQ